MATNTFPFRLIILLFIIRQGAGQAAKILRIFAFAGGGTVYLVQDLVARRKPACILYKQLVRAAGGLGFLA
jgi:hypothetical protein